MANDIHGRALANWQRCGAPKIPGVLVANVNRLGGRIAHRIIGPWRDLVLLRVQRPGAAGAVGGYEKAELRIGNDVDPGCRRPLAVIENHDVFTRSGVKAAETVEILECRYQVRRMRAQFLAAVLAAQARHRPPFVSPPELLTQGSLT